MAAVLPDTPWPMPVEAIGCTDKRGHGDHKVHNGWVWCGRCNTRLWPDPNRKRGAEYVRELVDTWPPLTTEQRDRLRPLLRPDAQPAT